MRKAETAIRPTPDSGCMSSRCLEGPGGAGVNAICEPDSSIAFLKGMSTPQIIHHAIRCGAACTYTNSAAREPVRHYVNSLALVRYTAVSQRTVRLLVAKQPPSSQQSAMPQPSDDLPSTANKCFTHQAPSASAGDSVETRRNPHD